MTRTAAYGCLGLLLVGIAGLLVALPRPATSALPGTALEAIPVRLGDWTAEAGAPGVLVRDDTASTEIVRTYRKGAAVTWLSLAYYTDQAEGRRPRVIELLFPPRGWTALDEKRLSLDIPGVESIPVTRINVRMRGTHVVYLYWYQLGSRAVASEHAYRAWLLYNRLAHGRADVAIVRVASTVPDGSTVDDVVATHRDFVREFYPALARTLSGHVTVAGRKTP